MNDAALVTRARSWTVWLLLAALLASPGFGEGMARAQTATAGTGGGAMVQVETPATNAVPATPPAPAAPRLDGPNMITGWHEGEPVPPGYHAATRTRTGAIVGGAVTLGVLYLLSALIASVWTDAIKDTHESNPVVGLFVPVLGPFITITQSSSATADLFLLVNGAAQTAGAALLIWGLTSPQSLLVKDGYYGRRHLMPQPMIFGTNGGGVGLSGTF